MRAWNGMDEIVIDMDALTFISTNADRVELPYSGNLGGEIYERMNSAIERDVLRRSEEARDISVKCLDFGFLNHISRLVIAFAIPFARGSCSNFYSPGVSVKFSAHSPILRMDASASVSLRAERNEVTCIMDRYIADGCLGLNPAAKERLLSNYTVWREQPKGSCDTLGRRPKFF